MSSSEDHLSRRPSRRSLRAKADSKARARATDMTADPQEAIRISPIIDDTPEPRSVLANDVVLPSEVLLDDIKENALACSPDEGIKKHPGYVVYATTYTKCESIQAGSLQTEQDSAAKKRPRPTTSESIADAREMRKGFSPIDIIQEDVSHASVADEDLVSAHVEESGGPSDHVSSIQEYRRKELDQLEGQAQSPRPYEDVLMDRMARMFDERLSRVFDERLSRVFDERIPRMLEGGVTQILEGFAKLLDERLGERFDIEEQKKAREKRAVLQQRISGIHAKRSKHIGDASCSVELLRDMQKDMEWLEDKLDHEERHAKENLDVMKGVAKEVQELRAFI